jgi:hypothetical protein
VAKQLVQLNNTSRTEYVFIQNSSSTTGAGLTGLVFNSAGLTADYVVERGLRQSITLATLASADAAWSSGGFIAVDGTNMPGLYRFDVPNAVFATADKSVVMLKGATNMAPILLEYQIVAFNPDDGVRLGITALPNAAAGANGGLPTGNASGQVTVAATASGALTSTSFAANSITASALATDAVIEIAGGVWDEAYSGHTTAGTFGKLMDILRKANTATEGSVSASGSPANSTVYFRTSLTGADNFYNSQTLLFTTGTLSGQTAVVSSFTSTNGVIQLADSLTTTPTAGDTFVVLGDHVWSREQIADGMLTRSFATAGAANNIAITSIVSNVFQAVNTLAVDDRITFVGTAPNSLALGAIYWVVSGSLSSTTFTISTTQGGFPIATSSTGAFTATKVTGRDMLSALRYLRNKVDISGSTMTVYQEDDTAAAWNAALTATAGVNPITTVDPS